MRIGGRLVVAHDRGLLVADAPVPRRDEGALPHPGLGFARGGFDGVVVMREAHIGQRPAVLHHPFLDVLAVDLAARDHAAAAIGRPDMTGPAFVLDMLCEFVARGNAAGPAFALGVEAKLIGRRRVDAAEANAAIADLDLVAVADFRHAGDVGGLSHRRHQQDRGGDEAGRECHRRSRGDGVIISVRDPRSAFNFALPGRANSEWRMAVEQGPLSPPYPTPYSPFAPFAIRPLRPRIIALRASASPMSTKAEVTSGPPTRIRVGVFILFHS